MRKSLIHFFDTHQLNVTNEDVIASKPYSSQLKGKNNIQTITNILEWQENNIEYWFERAESSMLIYIATIYIAVSLLMFFMLGMGLNAPQTLIYFIASVFIITIIYLLIPNKIVITVFFVLYAIAFLYILNSHGIKIPLIYFVFGGIIGIIIGALVEKFFIYAHYFHKKSLPSSLRRIFEMLELTLEIKLPLSKLLDYKTAICRDYAILSAVFLINSKTEPYYVLIRKHVATAVKINDYFYVIDQQLPLRQLDKWLADNKKSNCRLYKVHFKDDADKANVEFIQKYSRKNKKSCPPNIQKIEHDVNQHFTAKDGSCHESFKIHINKKAVYFYDEVTHLSVVRMIIKEIEKQFCNNVSQISRVEIKEENEGLIVDVYY
ncbi:transglutaminase-like domain-containing protein [Methanolobus halotolerans]|uniref:Transglutaminase-like domain-containing protein n=1 Tax=Methanolobus halotolerans TaxID=2052935 RepID=A0A4E0QRW6_9EURY|nr:transglutaminase-like domain-containing protein [Methanolobus halotolerans]TGC09461.1 hypothetical protein CUN85_06425 [Methanolobus halotolerans]